MGAFQVVPVKNPFHGLYSWLLKAAGFQRFSGHLLWVSGISSEWNLLDCGSNRGIFLKRTLEQLPPPKNVVCVEANPLLAQQLMEQWRIPITALNRAVVAVDADAEVEFTISENCEASSIYFSVASVFGVGRTVSVQTTTLQALVDLLPIGTPVVVKLDIEGAELDVLEQIPAECLQRIDQMTVEFHDNLDPQMVPRVHAIIQSMRKQGFVVVRGDAPGNEDVLFIAANGIHGWASSTQIMAAKAITLTRGILKTLFRLGRSNV